MTLMPLLRKRSNYPRQTNLHLFFCAISFLAAFSTHALASTLSSPQKKLNATLSEAKVLSSQGKHADAYALLQGAEKNIEKSAELYGAMIKSLANIDMDDAEETADDAIADFPKHAELHYLRGVIMGNQAQSSIFSALGYAEKSLNSFIRATELEPSTVKYRKALMSFYLAAPSIAGGDEALALEQLNAIKQADELEGASSQVAFYQMTDEPEKAIAELQTAIKAFPDEINLVFTLASFFAQQENYEKAMPLFQQAANMPAPKFIIDDASGEADASFVRNASAQLNALYQIGRTAVVTNKNTDVGIAAMGRLQAAVPVSQLDENNLPNMEWAKARIAELYIQSGDKKAAADLLAKIVVQDNKDLKKQVKKLKKML